MVDNHLKFESILTKFGQEIGIGPVCLNDRESCYLRFNQHSIVMEYSAVGQCLYIYTGLQEMQPTITQEKHFEHLLTANHFGQGTSSSWFSYNPTTQETFLMTKVSSRALEYDDFVFSLECFLNSIESSIQFLDGLKKSNKSAVYQDLHLKNPFA